MDEILQYIASFIALMLVLPLHEFAHAFVAVKSGDDTPKETGRYTLNPFKHFDIIGLVCMVVAHFGWAKPVMVNPNNFKRRTLDSFLVSIAGVLVNFITAFLFYPLFLLYIRYITVYNSYTSFGFYVLYYIIILSLNFSIFNFFPFYPLDGFRVIQAFTKETNRFRIFMENYSKYFLLALIALDIIGDYLSDLNYVFSYMCVLNNTIAWISNKILILFGRFWGMLF